MKLINASLMATTENGYTSQMRTISPEGYWSLPPGSPNFNEELVSITKEHGIELIFLQVQAPGIIDPNALKQCQELGAIIFALNGDMREELPSWHFDVAPYVDCFLFTNMLDVRRMRERGFKAEWIELGVDPDRYKDHGIRHPSPEIVFMANSYGVGAFPLSQLRIECVQRLKQEFGDNFGVYGSGWGNFGDGEFNSDQVREAQQYNSAKIALSISHFAVERYASDRLVRALASKCMVISHHYPNIEDSYTPGEHLVTFSDLDDLVNKCRIYLQNNEERERIALAGQKHVLENFTFQKMCENIKNLFYNYKNQ